MVGETEEVRFDPRNPRAAQIRFQPGLPDGIFSDQKSEVGYILEGLLIEDVGIVYVPLVYCWPFGIFCGHLVYIIVFVYTFSRFGMLYREKSGNPGFQLEFN
jgi:hypothetical protein